MEKVFLQGKNRHTQHDASHPPLLVFWQEAAARLTNISARVRSQKIWVTRAHTHTQKNLNRTGFTPPQFALLWCTKQRPAKCEGVSPRRWKPSNKWHPATLLVGNKGYICHSVHVYSLRSSQVWSTHRRQLKIKVMIQTLYFRLILQVKSPLKWTNITLFLVHTYTTETIASIWTKCN